LVIGVQVARHAYLEAKASAGPRGSPQRAHLARHPPKAFTPSQGGS